MLLKQTVNKIMRICYVLPTAAISGGINVIIEQANRFISKGHEVFFLQSDPDRTVYWYPDFKVPMYNIHLQESIRFYSSKPVDILIATGWQTVYEIIWRKLPARTYVYFFQADEKEFYPKDSTEHDLAAFTATLPFNYYSEARWLCKMLNSLYGHDVLYARNGLNFDFFCPAEPIIAKPKNRVRILLEGPLSQERKRMDDAFLAVEGLDAEVWLVTSGGDLKPWQKPDLMFKKVPISQMKNIYSACDVVVKLSSVEGMFGPPLEMMACGGTAVTSDVQGHDEYMIDGYNGFVVPIGDFRGAKSALEKLIDNPALMEEMKANGFRTARDFAWEPTIDKIEEYFLNLVRESYKNADSLDTNTIENFLNLSLEQKIALRLHVRRYFETTWQIGLIDATLETDRILDTQTCLPVRVTEMSMVKFKGWAFNTIEGQLCKALKLFAQDKECEIVNLEWCYRPDLVGFIGASASNSGFKLTSFFSSDFKSSIKLEAQYSSSDRFILPQIGGSKKDYGIIEELEIFNCYQIKIAAKIMKYPEGFSVKLYVNKNPDNVYIGLNEVEFWRAGFSLSSYLHHKLAIVDDIRLLSALIPTKKDSFFVWLPEKIKLSSIALEPSKGKTWV